MALTIIVEDGTGIDSANSYVDATYVADYAESIESSVWSNNKSRQSAALIQATRYVDMKYRCKLQGTIKSSSQSLLWPRTEITDNQGRLHAEGTIPTSLKDAVAAAALYYLEGGLDLNADEGNNIKSSSVAVGGGAVSEAISYFEKGQTKAYPIVDGFMSALLGKRDTAHTNNVVIQRG